MTYKVWTTRDIGNGLSGEWVLLGELSPEEHARLTESMALVRTMVELIAVVQELLEDQGNFEGAVAGASGPYLLDQEYAAHFRRMVENHIIWMSVFANSITTYLRRLDLEAGERFFGDQIEASQGITPLGLVRIMRNYIEHFCTLPVRFPLRLEAGIDAWEMMLKVEEVIAAADEEDFRLKAPTKEALRAHGDVDVVKTCSQAFEVLNRFVSGLPMRRALEEKVLPACDTVEGFLAEYAPDGCSLYISDSDSDEPKRGVMTTQYCIDAIRELYRNSPNADQGSCCTL